MSSQYNDKFYFSDDVIRGKTGATYTPSVSPEGIISWTNDRGLPNPEPQNIRGPKGDRGDKDYDDAIENLQEQIDELMYKPIAISSFTVSPSVIEKCADYDDEITLNFVINREPKTLKLDNQNITARASGSETRSNLSLSATKTFTLTATDEKPSGETDTVSKTAKVYMYNSIYYGVGPDRTVETSAAFDTFLNGLTSLQQGNKETEFTVNAGTGEYIWFALPKSLPNSGAVRFQAKGGLEGGFDAANEISHKNSSDYTEAYYVYRSTEANLGNVTIITF